jgi:Toprim domain
MVAAVVAGDGTFLACHRTYLEICPTGFVRKAPLRNVKLSLGSVAGGAIRIARGVAGRPWRRADPNEEVVGAEGVEDALTAALMMPERRVVAVIALGNLRHLILPPRVTRLLWCEQNDPPGSGAKQQLARAVDELRGQGVQVRFLRPPFFVKDLAEFQQRLVRAT